MRSERRNSQKAIALTIATVAAAIPIATIPAHRIDLTDPVFLAQWILIGVIGSFSTFLYFNLKMRDIIGTFTLGYMLAVILRFVADILISSYSHSDLSFSLLIAMAAGSFSGWFGAVIWVLMRKSRKKSK